VRAEAAALLQQTRKREIPADHFAWMYLHNPAGAARLWTVRNLETGELLGFTGALPRAMYVKGAPCRGWNCADFSMSPKSCTLGPALKLRRAAKLGVEAGEVDLLYAHPNTKMQLIHERVGHFRVGRMVRYAKPLRYERYLAARLGQHLATRLLASIVDGSMRCAERRAATPQGLSLHVMDEVNFTSAFDALADELRQARPILGVRDARHLHWRYRENPLYRTRAIVAERGSEVRGYLLYRVEQDVAHALDLFAAPEPGLVEALLQNWSDAARQAGYHSLSAVCLEKHPALEAMQRCGFHPRDDSSEMFAFAPDTHPVRELLERPESWNLFVGDRDV